MRRTSRLTLALLALTLAAPVANAQRDDSDAGEVIRDAVQGFIGTLWVPRARYTNSPHVRSAFRSVVAGVRGATVEVRSQGKRVARGGIVGPDGWIVTKASEVRGPVTCRLKDGREFDARLVGVDNELDLAMLKVDAKDLPTLDLNGPASREAQEFVAIRTEDAPEKSENAEKPPAIEDTTLMPGDWLATVGLGRDPIAVGVLSVLPRKIEKRPGFLGVGFNREPLPEGAERRAVQITLVQPDSAAEEVGLLVGDLIVSVDGTPTPDFAALVDRIGGHNPGDRIRLEILRADQTLTFVPILRGPNPNPAERRANYQNKLGSERSGRRFGFPSALQHDTVLDADDCGGPIVDLEGRVVGFNIARAGRTETYALPVEAVRDRLFELMSGRLAPVKISQP